MRGYVTWLALHGRVQDTIDGAHGCARWLRGASPTLYFYHAPEDVVSDTVAQMLKAMLVRYPSVRLEGRTVAPPPADDPHVPKPEELDLWNIRDIAAIADVIDVVPLRTEAEGQRGGAIDGTGVEAARAGLVEIELKGDHAGYLAACDQARALLKGTTTAAAATPARARAHSEALQRNRAELTRLGHWGVGVVAFEGQLYWGVDRLRLLERRIAAAVGFTGAPAPPPPLAARTPSTAAPAGCVKEDVHVYLSPRSPYSYVMIALLMKEGVLTDDGLSWYGASVVLRPMVPNAMRGIAIPYAKRMYIARDAARVCRAYGIPFGYICDPLGDASARILAVTCALLADGAARGAWEFLHAAMTGAWSRNQEFLSDAGIAAALAATADIPEDRAPALLSRPEWAAMVKANERELAAAHQHWGVPAVRVGGRFVWGQDRMWLVRRWLGDGAAEPEL